MGINLLVNVNGSGNNALESLGRYLYFDKAGELIKLKSVAWESELVSDLESNGVGIVKGENLYYRNKVEVNVVSVLSDSGELFGEVALNVEGSDGLLVFDVVSVGVVKRLLYKNEFLLKVVREDVMGEYIRVLYIFPLVVDVLGILKKGGVFADV